MACDDRQLTEAQRQAGYQNQRTGVQQAVRPFTGRPTIDNLIDYINRELQPAVRRTRDAVNDVYLQVADNAPSGNPLAYYFSEETAAADPTTGRIRLDASPQNTAATIRISQTNARLADVAPWLDVMAGSSTTPLGVVTLSDAINPGRSLRFDLNTMVDQGDYWEFGVAIIESSHPDPFVEGEGVVLAFIPGVASTGTTVPPGALTPIGPNTLLGNPTASTAAPTAIPVDALSVLGRKGLAGTGNLENITVPDTSTATGETMFLKGNSARTALRFTNFTLADIPTMGDLKFMGNVSGATARPAFVDLVQLAQDLFGIGFDNATHNFRLSDALDNTFLGNITGATTYPQPTPLSDLDSNSITYENVGKSFVREALGGDVTALQNNNTVTINAGAVTNAKLADMLAGTIKGRQIDAGTGAPVDLTGLEQGENLRLNTLVTDASTSGTATPYSIATDINWVRFSSLTGAYTLNGCDNVESGKIIVWHVEPGATGTLVLAHNNTGVTNAQRFFCPGAANLTLRSGETAITIQTVNRHRVIAVSRLNAITDADKGDITVSSGGTVWTIDNDVVSNAKLRDSGALSVIGRSANSSGDPADISATAASGAVLRESGSVLGFGTIATAGITDAAVTLAKMANLAAGTVIGRQVDAGTGVPVALTGNELGENLRIDTRVDDTTTSGTASPYTPVAADANWFRFTGLTGAYTLNGVDNTTSGRMFIWHVEPGVTGSLVLAHNVGAVNANRFFCPGAVDLTLTSGQTAITIFTSNRHRVVSVARGGFALTDGDKGDITLSSSTTVWTIDNDVVSNAKLRDSAALSVIGRSANSSGDPADISAANDAEVLRRSGTTLGFGTVATAGLANNAVTDAKFRQSAALTVIGRAANSTGDVADIGAGSDGHVLRRSGTALGFGTIATAGIGDDQVSDAKLRNSGALSVIGRSANSSGDPADISATAASGAVFRESGSVLGFGTIVAAGIASDAVTTAKILDANVTLAKMADLAQSSIIGRAEGAGTGVPTALTPTQVVSIIDGENATWTGSHAFNGSTLTASTSSNITLTSGSTVTLAATTQVQITSPTRLASSVALDAVNSTGSTAANDLAIGSNSVVRFTGPIDPLTGMVPVVDGQTVMLVNAHASVNMAIHIESASSSAANRFAGIGTSRVIRPGEMALAWYDGTSDRWRLLCRDEVDL